jgi:WD40 repeat-containing protein SMU1
LVWFRQARFIINMDAQDVPAQEVIGWVIQYLQMNNLSRSAAAVQSETGQNFNLVANPTKLKQDVLNGKWALVLSDISDLTLPEEVLFLLYEQVVLELFEKGDTSVAKEFMARAPTMISLKLHREQRFMKLEYLSRLARVTAKELYEPCPTREDRRQQVANALMGSVSSLAPDTLLGLIHDGMKFRAGLQQSGSGVGPATTTAVTGGEPDKMVKGPMPRAVRERIPPLQFKSTSFPESVCFSPDGLSLISGTTDGFIEVWNPATNEMRTDLKYQAADSLMLHKIDVQVQALCVSPDSSHIASGGSDGRLKIWDLNEGVSVRKIKAHSKGITSVSFAHDGGSVLSASADGTLAIHGMQSGQKLVEFRSHNGSVTAATFPLNSANAVVISGSSDGNVKCWDVKTGACLGEISLKEVTGHANGVVAILPLTTSTSSTLLVVGKSLTVLVVEVSALNGKLTVSQNMDIARNYPAPGAEFLSATLSPCETWIYAATTNNDVAVLERSSGEAMGIIALSDCARLTSVVHHPNSNLVAASGSNFISMLTP